MAPFPFFFSSFVSQFLLFLGTWWWAILPLVLFFPVRSLYLWWIEWEVWYKEREWIVLEVVPSGEILKPFRAMEDIFSLLWALIDMPNWRNKWCEGELPLGGGGWFSWEIASKGGEVHFYLRIPRGFRKTAEAAIYSQYPETEIFEVPDYTQEVPQDIPNKEYDLYGEDFKLLREDFYPIKTYSSFFEEKPEAVKEEKRLDPLNSLLEHISTLQEGERVWLQIVGIPILDMIIPWADKGREAVNKIMRRPAPEKQKSLTQSVIDELLGKGASQEAAGKEAKAVRSEESFLTPGEKQTVSAIENKLSKSAFQVSIRMLYIYKRNEPHFLGNSKIARSYFNHFSTANLNVIFFSNKTRTKIQYLFRNRRLYQRKKAIFRKYVLRFPPFYPDMRKGTAILNTEELATIFHFPLGAAKLPPGIPRVPARKGPPPGIPAIPTGKREAA